MKIVCFLVLLCIVACCQSCCRQEKDKTNTPITVVKLLIRRQRCRSQSDCCWEPLTNMCICQERRRGYFRGRRGSTRINVQFKQPNCFCQGKEGGRGGAGKRPIRITCNSVSNKGNKKRNGDCPKKVHNDCTYTGNPHKCRKYNKEQIKFYQELLAAIAPEQCKALKDRDPCPKQQFNTKKTCSEIGYKYPSSP